MLLPKQKRIRRFSPLLLVESGADIDSNAICTFWTEEPSRFAEHVRNAENLKLFLGNILLKASELKIERI
jgi:hypothetical protein